MKAAVFHETGGPEVLQVEEVESPQPGEGQVLIEVRAASVNPFDAKVRGGKYDPDLPAITGSDVSGTVVESNSPEFSAGDDVFGWASGGAAAELATASAELIAPKPRGVSHEQAAAIPVAGSTAWQALFDTGGLKSGQSALIAGAAGGVGHFAIQLAKQAGARVTGTGSSRNREFVLGLGADEYVDYREEDVSEAASGIDVAFDAVGGQTTATLVPTLAEGAVLVTIAGDPPEDAAAERGARAELLASRSGREPIVRIAELVEAGEVRVEIAEAIPLTEIQRAHELIESGHTRGKIVIEVSF